MTKKDFIFLADVMKDSKPDCSVDVYEENWFEQSEKAQERESQWEKDVSHLAYMLEQRYPMFDKIKFMKRIDKD